MPCQWSVLLDVPNPAAVQRRHLHAMVAGWLDRVFPQELHDHSIKPFSLGQWHTVDGVFVLPVRLLIDQLSKVLLESLAASGPLHLGGTPAQLIPAPEGTLARFDSGHQWEELLGGGPVSAWSLEFTTLTTFRSGDYYQPFPLPVSVLGHLRTRWTAFAPDELRYLSHTPLRELTLLTDQVDLRPAADTNYSARVHGVVGSVSQRVVGASKHDARAIGAWLSLARYAGIGYGTTRGYGVTRARFR